MRMGKGMHEDRGMCGAPAVPFRMGYGMILRLENSERESGIEINSEINSREMNGNIGLD